MLRQYSFLFMLFLTFAPTTVYAQAAPTEEQVQTAREYYDRAEIAFRQGRWLDCATHFERSFQTIFAAELLYNIGLCYERAAAGTVSTTDAIPHMERAVQAYARYVRELPGAEDASAVRVRLEDLRMLLDRARAPVEAPREPPQEPVQADPIPVEDDDDGVVHTSDIIVTAPPIDRDFGFEWTLTGGAFTVASFIVAVGLSAAAQEQFDHLAATCGQTVAGCSLSDVDSIVTLATGANVMYAVSGVLLAATGVAFGLELHFWSTPVETRAGLGYSVLF